MYSVFHSISPSFRSKARDEAEEVAWQIAATFAESLRSSWLDAETSKAALRKLRQIRRATVLPRFFGGVVFFLGGLVFFFFPIWPVKPWVGFGGFIFLV